MRVRITKTGQFQCKSTWQGVRILLASRVPSSNHNSSRDLEIVRVTSLFCVVVRTASNDRGNQVKCHNDGSPETLVDSFRTGPAQKGTARRCRRYPTKSLKDAASHAGFAAASPSPVCKPPIRHLYTNKKKVDKLQIMVVPLLMVRSGYDQRFHVAAISDRLQGGCCRRVLSPSPPCLGEPGGVLRRQEGPQPALGGSHRLDPRQKSRSEGLTSRSRRPFWPRNALERSKSRRAGPIFPDPD